MVCQLVALSACRPPSSGSSCLATDAPNDGWSVVVTRAVPFCPAFWYTSSVLKVCPSVTAVGSGSYRLFWICWRISVTRLRPMPNLCDSHALDSPVVIPRNSNTKVAGRWRSAMYCSHLTLGNNTMGNSLAGGTSPDRLPTTSYPQYPTATQLLEFLAWF